MKKKILAIFAAVLLLNACGDGKMSLTSYHEKAISTFNASSEKMVKEREIIFESKLSKEENQKLVNGLNANIDSAITMMNGLKYPDDAKDFHESMLKIYTFEKDSIMPLLSKTLEHKPKSKEWYATWREFDKRTERVDGLLNILRNHQKKLAKKANMTVR